MKKALYILLLSVLAESAFCQNQLLIPPTLTGTNFNLNIQNGVTQFYQGINTPTYGINGPLLAPTLVLNKWDWVTMNVTNNLTGFGNSTTIHWHGLHVPAEADGGPHQIILQGTTWSPLFQVLNTAGTFWYHPHGDHKTDLHVSRGIAGMIIIKDSSEASLNLPRTYGVDDFPIIVQSKAFDILNQIAISTEMDTAVCVNGVMNPFLDVPAQVIRFRMLNGSSSRVYNFGFTGNLNFNVIASDGGLLDNPVSMNRLRLAPGERAEILLDLQAMNGQTINLISFSSELPNGIYGASTVIGPMGGTIPDYNLNPLNGADFTVLQLNIIAPTSNPVITIPSTLITNTPYSTFTVSRNFNLFPDTMMSPVGQVEGPFNINGVHFDMSVINETVYLNDTEKWRITNNTGIAHPFHIHDVQFYLLNINGSPVPAHEQGQKDVVLVPPQQYVEFITKFENFANDSVPYMYHCHMLHHEDEGMMGSFVVIDTTAVGIQEIGYRDGIKLYPNPSSDILNIKALVNITQTEIVIYNMLGLPVSKQKSSIPASLDISHLEAGLYYLAISDQEGTVTRKFLKN